jgi:hypothetical protein
MNRTLRKGATRPAGYTFHVPSADWLGADRKSARPYFLVERVEDPSELEVMGTLALMTSKDTEGRQYGALLHEIAPMRGRLRLRDQASSYVNACWVLFRASLRLRTYDGVHTGEVPAVKAMLSGALGLAGDAAAEGGSIRGRLVHLSEEVSARFAFEYGIVLTADSYSVKRRWQTIVPVVDVASYLEPDQTASDFVQEDTDVLPEPRHAWCRQLPAGWTPVIDTVLLSTFSERWTDSRNPSFWLDEQIDHVFPLPVDPLTMARIESALAKRLCLPR